MTKKKNKMLKVGCTADQVRLTHWSSDKADVKHRLLFKGGPHRTVFLISSMHKKDWTPNQSILTKALLNMNI